MLLLPAGAAVFLFQICCANLLSWSDLALLCADLYTAQRDISNNDTIDQLTFFGVSLNRVVFDIEGYSNTSLSTVKSYLDMKYSLFMVDLYWNHFTQNWQLCPAPIPANETIDLSKTVEVLWNNETYNCMPGFSVTDLFQQVNSYLFETNVRLEANVVQFAFNLRSIYHEVMDTTPSNSTLNITNTAGTSHDLVPAPYRSYSLDYLSVGSSTLKDSLSAVKSYIFSPLDLQLWDLRQSPSGDSVRYPTQDAYLFSLYKRVFPFVLSNTLHNSSTGYNISSSDTDTIFFPDEYYFLPWVETLENGLLAQNISDTLENSQPSDFCNWGRESHFRFVVDDEMTPFTNQTVNAYLESGFSAILNSSNVSAMEADAQEKTLQIANSYTPVSFWSWASDQFYDSKTYNETNSDQKYYQNDDVWYIRLTSQTAYLCVSITTDGWAVQNCYDKMRGVCQNDSDPYSWELTSEIKTYIDWLDEDEICPEGFSAGIPHLSLEQFSLRSVLVSKNVLHPVWIDLNDITVSGCYVLGGPYALCPYQEVLSTRNFVKSLAPSSVIALFFIFLIFCERILIKTPIHTNRKRYWKRKIADYYKDNDYEGVPL
ncbi:hypothetical protein METBIDRAFT_10412 [Metschnikowia bicuspidata var. bicuspidata NRRL YB-4993]|uniref:Maintenance of telomere capping protein 6 n=1 Tax=Metschnikowia bicuspidata var. bicuspidata NRRL YB-4993 TaxID=869754 RepID=A0A1A0HKC9_9ASCO|nr:hypothetical protein METBIDRAFT_10412 [Metschnikowia bicuspidata var. bicuspidata NRRL YB-4993]OBA24258.1 hypothetical protein METBIDRAFT_10412 [Metschnikowia bicuspidata var. bicuspidata NRRL YB-4993]